MRHIDELVKLNFRRVVHPKYYYLTTDEGDLTSCKVAIRNPSPGTDKTFITHVCLKQHVEDDTFQFVLWKSALNGSDVQ